MARFADRLRELRVAAGLTQEQLAERAGMHKLGVAKLEQGLREPAWATVQAVAHALGVNCLAFTDGGHDTDQADPSESSPVNRPRGRPKREPAAPPAKELEAVSKRPRARGKGKQGRRAGRG